MIIGTTNFSVRVLDKTYQNPLVVPDVELGARRYSHRAIGGPKEAEIWATGNERGLWEMLEWLRCPIEIWDERKSAVWWGYIHEIELSVGAVRVGVSLDEFYDRVAVAYSYVAPGSTSVGNRATTAWAQDDDAVAAYGTKELLSSASGAMTAQAEAMRDAILAEKRLPPTTLSMTQIQASNSAVLRCRGWWETLGWKYYANLSGKESYEELGGTMQNVGQTSNPMAAQSFQIGSGTAFDLASVMLRTKKIGTPSDNLVVSVLSDSAGQPGAELASVSLPASVIPGLATWVEFIFDNLVGGGYVQIATSTTYWLKVSRSGSTDDNNYYQVDVNENLTYSRGVFKIHNGSSWAARSPDADMNFQVLGGKETTAQIQDIITASGQFFSGSAIYSRSNLISNHYRTGDKSALVEIEALLKSGVKNGRRLLATVTSQRELLIKEEPAQDRSSAEVYVKRDGSVESVWGNELVGQACPVGMWAVLKDVLPSSLDLGRLADPSMFFIEEASYYVDRNQYVPVPRGRSSPYDIISRIVEG